MQQKYRHLQAGFELAKKKKKISKDFLFGVIYKPLKISEIFESSLWERHSLRRSWIKGTILIQTVMRDSIDRRSHELSEGSWPLRMPSVWHWHQECHAPKQWTTFLCLSLSHAHNLLVIDDTLLSTLYVGVTARGVTLPCFTGSQTFIKTCFLYMSQSRSVNHGCIIF